MIVWLIRDECTGYYHLGGNTPSFNDTDPPRFYNRESSAKTVVRKLTRWCNEHQGAPYDYQVIMCRVTPLS